MRLAKASSPEDSSRMPDRFLPASSAPTMCPSVVVCGSCKAVGVRLFHVPRQTGAAGQQQNRGDDSSLNRVCAHHSSHDIRHTLQPCRRQRRIRSFVLRAGRTTPAQERALKELWPAYGIDLTGRPLDLAGDFRPPAPRCLEIGFGAGEVIGTLAETNPHIDYLGIEVHRSGVGRLLLRAQTERTQEPARHLPRRRRCPARSCSRRVLR